MQKKANISIVLTAVLLLSSFTTLFADNPPFGSFDKPLDGFTVSGVISVTGWALDDEGVVSLQIFRDPIAGEGAGMILLGDAVFIEGNRPDITLSYPGYPNNAAAGWIFNLVTNSLPNGGNGTFALKAIVTDTGGNTVTLGTKTTICDNANAVKPFGNIDSPGLVEVIFGDSFPVQGWVLTPLPNTIPVDGSTITIFVDGIALGSPFYNIYRQDISILFPGNNNSNGAGFLFYLNTTLYSDGVHIMVATVSDDAGNSESIGSRYFTINNDSSPVTDTNGVNPETYRLYQNYPNPFNPSTKIEYIVKEPCLVNLVVYNLTGQFVKEFVNSYQQPGIYSFTLNMQGIPSGIYFYRIRMGDFQAVKKMVKIE